MDEQQMRLLEEDALSRLAVCEKQREQLGKPDPQEPYWGGFVDALCKARGGMTRSKLDWMSDGVTRMFSKEEMEGKIRELISGCTDCELHQSRTNTVPSDGPLRTALAVVGEGPGKDEDAAGTPFIGECGDLLFHPETGLIPTTIGFHREHTHIRNVVCCRPPGNRNPKPEEVQSCSRYLRWGLLNVDPKVIVAFGNFAASWFYGQKVTMAAVRGKPFNWQGITVVPTYHPGYLLRNAAETDKVKEDLELALAQLKS